MHPKPCASPICRMSNSSFASVSVKTTSTRGRLRWRNCALFSRRPKTGSGERALFKPGNPDPVVASHLSLVGVFNPVVSKPSNPTSCQPVLTISFPLKHPCPVIGSDRSFGHIFSNKLFTLGLLLYLASTRQPFQSLAPLGKSHQALARLRRPRCLVLQIA